MKKKYQISLWKDEYVTTDNGGYYQDKLVAILGSDTMQSLNKAYSPKMVPNINGTNTFSFTIKYSYTDTISGEEIKNPFANMIHAESRIKVYWNDKWYDFVVKNCVENSSNHTITYTCKDLFINELSKTGYEIEFDDELMNNTGTVAELTQTVLEGSDWQYNAEKSEPIYQLIEEPVLEAVVKYNTTVNSDKTGASISLLKDTTALLYYSQFEQVQDIEEYPTTFQFHYAAGGAYKKQDGTLLVINGDTYSVVGTWQEVTSEAASLAEFTPVGSNTPLFRISMEQRLSERFRAKRYSNSEKMIFDSRINRYVTVYKDDDRTIYGYSKTVYNSPSVVMNLLANTKNFTTIEGWSTNSIENPPIQTVIPLRPTEGEVFNPIAYLTFKSGVTVYNRGPQLTAANWLYGITKDVQYTIRIKGENVSGLSFDLGYLNNETWTTLTSYIAGEIIDGWQYGKLTCLTSLSVDEQKNLPICLRITNAASDWKLQDIQLYAVVLAKNTEGELVEVTPDNFALVSAGQIKYYYYDADINQDVITEDDLVYVSISDTPQSYVTLYEAERIGTINMSKSNRFNILQKIAETFECYCHFEIVYNANGSIQLDENNHPKKYVYFTQEAGKETGIGFIYGLDLKAIQRTIDSNNIVTKTIVNNNSNEFAENGFCSIARSKNNFSRSNVIYNFDYYVEHGLIDYKTLNDDLYFDNIGLGYYKKLNIYNTQYDKLSEELNAHEIELAKLKANYTILELSYNAKAQEVEDLRSELTAICGLDSYSEEAVKKYAAQTVQGNATITSKYEVLKRYESDLTTELAIVESAKNSVAQCEERLVEIGSEQDELLALIKAADLAFYNKYSHFIQEGAWISEDYVDDDLYYLDAKSVAYTSARPQVTYNVSVIRLSELPEFKNKIINVGDIAYMQDTDFFGYVDEEQKTPWREKVIIAEITYNFDDPSKDSIKVQNYKSQYDDLFQRITAQTQNLQFSQGVYERGSRVVNIDGTLNVETLEASLANNEAFVYNAQNQSYQQDNTGILLTDLSNPDHRTKITSDGVFITQDGGLRWNNAIRGTGISASNITSGVINTNQLMIMDKSLASFRWDKNGISAYQNINSNVQLNKFVRFDQYGIYGIKDWQDEITEESYLQDYIPAERAQALEVESPLDAIKNDARFGLTWDGLFIKSSYDDGGTVEISNENNINITDGSGVTRLKIGATEDYVLTTDTEPQDGKTYYKMVEGSYVVYTGTDLTDCYEKTYDYGIILRDNGNTVTLETDDSGRLWLRDKLNISDAISLGYDDIGTGVRSILRSTNDSGQKFIIFEDGSFIANAGSFGGLTVSNGILNIGNLEYKDNRLRIANFFIKENYIADIDGDDAYIEANAKLYLKAPTADSPSKMYAENLEIGQNAVIRDYLELSQGGENQVFFRNPSNNSEECWLDVRQNDISTIRGFADGTIEIGDLLLDGNNGGIISGDNWSIDKNSGYFNNISVSGTINCASFTESSTQAVGSSMLFRESYEVVGQTENTVTVAVAEAEQSQFEIGTKVVLLTEDGNSITRNITSVTPNTDKTQLNLTFNVNPGSIIHSIILISTTHPYIGINGSFTNTSILPAEGFSIVGQDNNGQEKILLFMGNLNNLQDTSKTGYGLYCDNVFLNGQIDAEGPTGIHAGINTKSGAIYQPFIDRFGDNSPIVFYAGASNSNGSNGVFLVSQQGSLYIQNGLVEEGFFSQGYINSSAIYSSDIYGTNQQNYGLRIHDYSDKYGGVKGIGFYNKDTLFADMNSQEVNFYGNEEKTSIAKNIFGLYANKGENTELLSGIRLNADSIEFLSNNKNSVATLSDNLYSINSNRVEVKNIISYNQTMEYRPVMSNGTCIGYDIYIM